VASVYPKSPVWLTRKLQWTFVIRVASAAAKKLIDPDLEKFSRGAWRTMAVSLETAKNVFERGVAHAERVVLARSPAHGPASSNFSHEGELGF
jgi:hypothetical protein